MARAAAELAEAEPRAAVAAKTTPADLRAEERTYRAAGRQIRGDPVTGPITYHEASTGSIVDQMDRYRELAQHDALAGAIAIGKARGTYVPNEHVNEEKFPPLTVAEHLEMLALGERIARYYRHPSQVDKAVKAGASWAQIAAATGTTDEAARAAYREWAEGQHQLHAGHGPGRRPVRRGAQGRRRRRRPYDRPPGPVQDPRRRPGPRRAGRGGHADVHPGDPGRDRLRRALRAAGLQRPDPAGRAGEVEKITAPGVKPVYWRRLAPLVSLPPMTVCSDRDRRRPS